MKTVIELLKEIEGLGYGEADIASHLGKTGRTIQYWRSGKVTPPASIYNKLAEMAKWPPRYEAAKIEDDNIEMTLLRVQNIALNIEAKQNAQAEILKMILAQLSGKSTEEIKDFFEQKLSESQSDQIRGSNIVHKNRKH